MRRMPFVYCSITSTEVNLLRNSNVSALPFPDPLSPCLSHVRAVFRPAAQARIPGGLGRVGDEPRLALFQFPDCPGPERSADFDLQPAESQRHFGGHFPGAA